MHFPIITIKLLYAVTQLTAVLNGKIILQPVKLPVVKGMVPYSKA